MIRKLFLFLVLVFNVATAQTIDEMFVDANTLYKEGAYLDAIKLYKEIEQKKQESSELYYNLGNCYYKLNKVASTIYNYEKALKLNPRNKDARNNLIFAKKMTLDRIEPLPKSVFQRFNKIVLKKLSYDGWSIIAIIFSIAMSVFFLLFYFTNTSSKKKIFFVTALMCLLLLVTTIVITQYQYSQSKNDVEAVIFAEEASVKNEPIKDGEETFVIHEGAKVKVLDTVDNWKKIKLSDGKTGWVLTEYLKII